MTNSRNSLAEIQAKYQNCNLLIPSATSLQINPFYKCTVMEVVADTSPSSGDIFKVGASKVGEDQNGKAIYEDVYSPAKPLLMKLATTAGIQFHPEYTKVNRINANTYEGKAFGAVRLPDGSYKTHADSKTVNLDDEEAKYRLDFMDKSILGIKDWRAATEAAKMFKGEWKTSPDEKDRWGKPLKYYVITDCDRDKYIERSILVNMTLLRKTAPEKAQTGAILRVIRALLGIKGTYTINELTKPFAVPTVAFSPDYTDASVRQAMLQQGMNSMGNIFGSANIPVVDHSQTFTTIPQTAETFDVEANLDNPAFASDVFQEEEYEVAGQAAQPYEPENQQVIKDTSSEQAEGFICDECGTTINERVFEYSIGKYGRPLCMKCQKGAR